jgi:hypothetical protein
LLLLLRFREAELFARSALTLNKTNEFACYVAAEACLQRTDSVAAHGYIHDYAPAKISDEALLELSNA